MENTLNGFSVFIDSGLLTLIWIVQVVVYPALTHISPGAFKDWHDSYTRKMGYIAGPLMIAQLCSAALSVYQQAELRSILYLGAVAGTWGVTFAFSVPLHKALHTQGPRPLLIQKLISTNWMRTLLWTVIPVRHFV